MKVIVTCCFLLVLTVPTLSFSEGYMGTFCWLDEKGNTIELSVSPVGNDKGFTYSGVYHTTKGLSSPVYGNVNILNNQLAGVFTSTERVEIQGEPYVTDFVGNISLNLSDLNGSLWGTARATNISTDQITSVSSSNDLTFTNCPE